MDDSVDTSRGEAGAVFQEEGEVEESRSDPRRGNRLITALSRLMWDLGSGEMKEDFGPGGRGGGAWDFHSCG